MSIIDILGIVGGLALFLYGIQTLGDALKAVSGSKMEQILATLTSNKWKGALLGMLVTAVIQSSGATIVMVVGFVNSEIMSLHQAVGVILGANIGTTITAWLLSLSGIQGDNLVLQLLKPENFAPILGIVGVFMMMLCKRQRNKDVGWIMTSFAVLLIGMTTMSSGAAPLTENEAFTNLLIAFSNPILGMLAGLIITVILQSSSASVGILQSLSLTGAVPMSSAIPVIMGENIGSAITGVLGAIGASRNARRASFIQLFYCFIKTGVFMIGFYSINAFYHLPIMDQIASPVSIAIFHSIFNICAVCIMLPFSDILIKIVERVVPVTADELAASESRKELQMLNPKFITSPAFAIQQCQAATARMGQYTKESIALATGLVLNYNDEDAVKVDQLERTVDQYEDELNGYLVQMSNMNFQEEDTHMFSLLIHTIGDYERMSDHALNIMQSARDMQEKHLTFSPKAQEELQIFNRALNDIAERTVTAFQNSDQALAATVEPLEEVIDGLNEEVKRRHVRRLRKGKCTIELGVALEDVLTDYERIADHCNNIAVHMGSLREDGFDSHTYLKNLSEVERKAFKVDVDEYTTKYALPDAKLADIDDVAPAVEDTKSKKKDKEKKKLKKKS